MRDDGISDPALREVLLPHLRGEAMGRLWPEAGARVSCYRTQLGRAVIGSAHGGRGQGAHSAP